ncbi:SpoIIE family protein phosphatase [Nannocystis sp. SCPEA4]|uniref:SpoIIE family protein phosphatase n=1 Tax=Nannocystis sp. SCPEA4 TaxID=2996787 RepID=UPI00226EFB98|nr:SpoIIE family protein phosphatase [Nannocystis sp. SCPEA4]MCY1054346.1 SpoIIE family protein phosphatase [Nannocystis sp. SCPEA4]
MFTTAYRTTPKTGERENGDAVLVRRGAESITLAVIDGLGHGRMAALAAHAAIECLNRLPLTVELEEAMRAVHEALRGTRGAAGAVCQLGATPTTTPGTVSFICCGVGNVEIRCFGAKLPILLSPGVLGARVQSFRICRGELPSGSRLVMFSDGISQRSPFDSLRHLDPEPLCETLMREHRKPDDDASVLVCDTEA